MDIKLKDNKEVNINHKHKRSLYIINAIAILFIFIASFIMVNLYSKIQESANENDPYIYENTDFLDDIVKSNYVIYKDFLESKEGRSIDASEIYMRPQSEFADINIYNTRKRYINSEFNNLENYFQNYFRNIDYAILDKDGNEVKSNNNLSKLIKSNDIEELDNKYSFYIVINFNENGEINVSKVYGGDENKIKKYLSEIKLKDIVSGISKDAISVSPIKNMTFQYGINKDLRYGSEVFMYSNGPQISSYWSISYIYVLILGGIISILSLLIPLKLEEKIIFSKKVLNIPFEVLLGITCTILAIILTTCREVILYTLNSDFINEVLVPIGIQNDIGEILVYLFNLAYWAIFIGTIFICILTVKNIFKVGFINYFKEKTLVGNILRFIKRSIKKVIKSFENVDLSDKSNKVLLKFVGINFIIVLILSSMWFFGWVVAVFYSIGLFLLLRKYYDNLRDKFTTLLNTTNKIAEGNLDATIDEDLGLFNPFKDEIEKIQNGFKKAVDEEVKSQRMKTELISNVSHDLKTPLTSIITYVDLLKSDNLTEEERKSYIDTLDRKSQRLKYLIEDLFEVSKATSGNISLNIAKVDVVELMKQTEIELEDKIKSSNLDIRNNFSNDKVILELDSQKTFRIFENLLTNVAKYALIGTRVYVDIIDREESVMITIKNMSAEEINFNAFDIVERFERGDKSRNTEGSGLGLAIVKSFVEVQGGKFDLEIDGDLFKVIIQFKK